MHMHMPRFTYVNVQGNSHVALGSVTSVMSDVIGAPKQGHISYTDYEDEIAVTYVSGSNHTPFVR